MNFENIYRRLEITDQEVYSRIAEVEQAVVRHTDSRVDKLETKVYKDFDLIRTQGTQLLINTSKTPQVLSIKYAI